jgi:sugar O-acyltransferase (sialic acid O-acetyltransferase NeuD family)
MITVNPQKSLILIGAGGHAKSIWDAIHSQGLTLTAYVDPESKPWLDSLGIHRIEESSLAEQLQDAPQLIMGFLGLDTNSLAKRQRKMEDYRSRGAIFPVIAHTSTIISTNARIDAGVQLMAGSIVNGFATIEPGAVINTRAIVEHDVRIGVGSHIAPGATVLGGAIVGACCYIGSNAVVIQNSTVAPCTLVKASSFYNETQAA